MSQDDRERICMSDGGIFFEFEFEFEFVKEMEEMVSTR